MTPFEAYQLYMSLKNHFNTENYDFIKFKGKAKNTTYDRFLIDKNNIYYTKLAKNVDLKNFLIANFVDNSKAFVRDLAYGEESKKIYNKWISKRQSLTYNFKADIIHLSSNLKTEITIVGAQHPKLLQRFLQREILLETFIILTEILNCISNWDIRLKDDIIWKGISFRIKKYKPFLELDQKKFKKILFDHVKCINSA